jgi:hypothetical protein
MAQFWGQIGSIHAIYGERVLPLLIVIAAIWFTVTWKAGSTRTMPMRIFPVLVDMQAGLGILYWVYLISVGVPYMLQFPFILHPILGVLAAGLAHMAVGKRNPVAALGRWSPLASMGVLLVIVLSAVVISTSN